MSCNLARNNFKFITDGIRRFSRGNVVGDANQTEEAKCALYTRRLYYVFYSLIVM